MKALFRRWWHIIGHGPQNPVRGNSSVGSIPSTGIVFPRFSPGSRNRDKRERLEEAKVQVGA